MKLEEKAEKISIVLKEWFKLTGKVETTPEEIMPYLFEKNIYLKNNREDALKLRNDLRELVKRNQLSLIKEARFEQKNKNKNWFFIKC